MAWEISSGVLLSLFVSSLYFRGILKTYLSRFFAKWLAVLLIVKYQTRLMQGLKICCTNLSSRMNGTRLKHPAHKWSNPPTCKMMHILHRGIVNGILGYIIITHSVNCIFQLKLIIHNKGLNEFQQTQYLK